MSELQDLCSEILKDENGNEITPSCGIEKLLCCLTETIEKLETKEVTITVDSALSSTSTNPVQNKVITKELGKKASSDHSHNYLPLSGGTMTNTINSSKTTGTYLKGNQGQAIINSTATAGSYTVLDKLNSTNGYFTDAVHNGNRILSYTSKNTVSANSNSVTKLVTLLNESGNTTFPGTVTASAFNGNATSASKINGCTVKSNVPESAVFTDTTYTISQSGTTITLTGSDGSKSEITISASTSDDIDGGYPDN